MMSDTSAPATVGKRLANGLVYVTDGAPGIRRIRCGTGFSYRDPAGRLVTDQGEIGRIRRLAIPPAYERVWICPLANGHLQASGRDARGRKQYRYHDQWRVLRDEHKFDRLPQFGRALPALRRAVQRMLAAASPQRPDRLAVLATIVRLLDTTLMRVGNDCYARDNDSFGLTTLRNQHAAVRDGVLRLRFRGKSGVQHDVSLADPRVARIVRRCQQLPGQDLFACLGDDGSIQSIDSGDVNDFLRELTGEDLTAKDFRTWHGSVLTLDLLAKARASQPLPTFPAVLREVATRLGNTPAVCRKAYVHPRVLELGAGLALTARAERDGIALDPAWRCLSSAPDGPRGLCAAERRLLCVLETRSAFG